jgi:hypothetical protein
VPLPIQSLVPPCMPEPCSKSPSLRQSIHLIPKLHAYFIITCHVISHFEQQQLSAITVVQAVSIRLPSCRLPLHFVGSHRYLYPPCPPPPPPSAADCYDITLSFDIDDLFFRLLLTSPLFLSCTILKVVEHDTEDLT